LINRELYFFHFRKKRKTLIEKNLNKTNLKGKMRKETKKGILKNTKMTKIIIDINPPIPKEIINPKI
jgi:hypothetical protein